MIPKRKQVRLKGKAMLELVQAVYERDQHKCVNCGRWVEDGHKPHHVCYKSHGGGDTLDNLVLLCPECHYQIHHGKNGAEVKDKVRRYLEWMNNEI